MKLYGNDGSELMTVSSIERQGSNLVIRGKIMGAMPLSAILRPAEARSALRLLNLKTFLFLLTLPWRRDRK